jgi:hypothetical protein
MRITADPPKNKYPVLPAKVLHHLFQVTIHQEEIARVQHEVVPQVSGQVVHQNRVQAEEHVQDLAVEPAQVPAAQVNREDANLVYLANAFYI